MGGFRGRGMPPKGAANMPKRKRPIYMKQSTKRGRDEAELVALIQKQKPFSLQRLMHDYNEIKNQKVPIPGVSAIPLGSNFYVWHGNIKAPNSGVYKGAVLHLEFNFTNRYPIDPPTIIVLNKDFHHPNVMENGSICLDMLEKKNEKFRGWRSSYTVLSILLQLQAFFFDIDEKFIKKQEENNTDYFTEQIIKMNEFKCPQCKHKGSSNPYPEIISGDKVISKFSLNPEEYRKEKMKELCCYHRKTTFQENPLGLGISISKNARTGEVKGIVPCFSFISLKSYTKERVRMDENGVKFTHWYPLYFGEKKDEFIKSLTKAISMIAKGNTKEFEPSLILKCIPKFFNYVALNILSEKVHNSSRAISTLISIYRGLLILLRKYPEFKAEINERVGKFIKDEKNRTKTETPSLGDLLVMLSLSEEHTIESLLPGYISEQMDRQILWILQEIPEFEDLVNSSTIDKVRTKICFKSGLVGEQLLLFYYYFLKKIIYGSTKTLDEFADKLDKNFGNLTEEEIDKHREEINKILKIDNFNDYYKYMNLTPPTEDELNKKLKQSFDNSLKKGYHGTDEVRFVPSKNDQLKSFFEREYTPLSALMKDKDLLPEDDPKWAEALNKLDVVKRFIYTYPNEKITPLNIIRFQRKNLKENLFFDLPKNSEEEERQIVIDSPYKKEVEDEKIIEKLSFRKLYIKLWFEDYVKYFPNIYDFKELYNYLDIVNKEIVHFKFVISDLGSLKSDWNYVRAILSKLSSIKYLCFIFTDSVGEKLLKNIMKGITNGTKSGSEISHLKIITKPSISIYSSKDVNLLTVIDKLQKLSILDLSQTTIDKNISLRIRNHLYYYKEIEILDLSNSSINDEMAKEVIDGIMKAKSLRKIYLSNTKMKNGLSSLLYNLAFLPTIKVIDISKNKECNTKEISETLYKLLKMSPTIEYLICNSITNLNKELTKDFFYSLGDSSSLKYLDLSLSGNFSDVHLLGNAVAFNALKGGELKALKISETQFNYQGLVNFVKALEISESDHFQAYGFQFNTSITKDSGDYYSKNFCCKLEYLDLSKNTMNCYTNIYDIKSSLKNEIKNLFCKTKSLKTLILDETSPTKYFLDVIADSLDKENGLLELSFSKSRINGENFKALLAGFYKKGTEEPNPNFKIQKLNLSSNSLGFNGVEELCKALKTNKTVKSLNVFHNLFSVDGARKLEDALKVNSTLEELDVGYNRIKSIGFSKIVEGIKANPNSKVKFLGVKYNFIKDGAFAKGLKEIEKSTKIEKIEIKNNEISQGFLGSFYKEEFSKFSRKIVIDCFELLYYLDPERLERTVWVSCGKEATVERIYEEIQKADRRTLIEDNSRLGIPVFISKKRGRKVGEKKNDWANDCFIEFILPNSTNRMLKVASSFGFTLGGKRTKVFKAGTKPDYLLVKKKVLR